MNSNTLFSKQVEVHSQALCELLTAPCGVAVSAKVIERAHVTAKMLAGSASLVGLPAWERLLRTFEAILFRYSTNGYAWDERIAQVTSEIIEKEETFTSAFAADPESELEAFVDDVELTALVTEMIVLEEECESGLWPEKVAEGTPADAGGNPVDLYEMGASDADEIAVPMVGVIEEFGKVSRELCTRMNSYSKADYAAEETLESVLESIGKAQFCIDALDGFVERARPGGNRLHRGGMGLLHVSMKDYANELCAGTGRELSVRVEWDKDLRVDGATLFATDTILRSMIHDIFQRREGQAIKVLARATDRFGSIHWSISDNADNFVSDSRLDHEDQLAFYPSLKKVIHIVGENYGLLWVEPNNGKEARFEFRLPVSRRPDVLCVWGSARGAFALRSSQVCEFLAGASDSTGSDSHGEFVIHDGRRVPLVRLDTLYSEAEADGSKIAVVGFVEKRVAFYVSGEGTPSEGSIAGDTRSLWEGQLSTVVIHDGSRMPLLDANDIVRRYLTVTGALTHHGVSGGATQHDTDYFQSQAASRVDVIAPSDRFSSVTAKGTDVPQVLVVDQSDSVRDEFADILSRDGLRAVFAEGPDEAIDLLASIEPNLIISEFRMPTMAAKRLVDVLRDQGRSIPVLVTTSQTGQTAELLVEKLGVSGYVAKPLVAADVTRLLDTHLRPRLGP